MTRLDARKEEVPVLVSGHGADDEAVAAARRAVPYRRLILLSTTPTDPRLARLSENEGLAGVAVTVIPVDAGDVASTLVTARRVLSDNSDSTLRVHVAGGPNLLTSALLLAAFERGVEAFFCVPRGPRPVVRLPVALDVAIEERVGLVERTVLLALDASVPTRVAEIAAPALSSEAVKGALLRLRRAGLVAADAVHASLTPTGASYRAHFAMMGQS